jgi:predicted esterase
VPPTGVPPTGDIVARHVRVPRTARYHVLGDVSAAREAWFVLHGYGQLAGRFIERFRSLPGAGEARAVVAPEALSRFYVERRPGAHGTGSRVGASWMTREDREREIEDYVEYLDRVAAAVAGAGAGPDSDGGAVGPRRVVLGFSQGAETASRWAVLGATRPAELVLWGGGLAADLDLARAGSALDGVAIRFVVGDRDAWAADRARDGIARLRAVGLEAERIDHPGGHRIYPDVLARTWPPRDP